MQFIGRDQVAAPKLKDAELSPEEATSAYHQVLTGMKSMYKWVLPLFPLEADLFPAPSYSLYIGRLLSMSSWHPSWSLARL